MRVRLAMLENIRVRKNPYIIIVWNLQGKIPLWGPRRSQEFIKKPDLWTCPGFIWLRTGSYGFQGIHWDTKRLLLSEGLCPTNFAMSLEREMYVYIHMQHYQFRILAHLGISTNEKNINTGLTKSVISLLLSTSKIKGLYMKRRY
jgi:hypothetical protein